MMIMECDLRNSGHRYAFAKLLNAYIQDAMGGGGVVEGCRKKKILSELGAHSAKLILLAKTKRIYVGMAVCFWVYSTFSAAPALNIHDIIVLPDYRGKGIGRKLMDAVEARAVKSGCAKITLEVRHDNAPARHLYSSMGYGECCPSMSFWVKRLSVREVK